MKGQKQAVVDLVLEMLPGFKQHQDIALMMLTRDQLEQIMRRVGEGLYSGVIEYSKPDKTNIFPYARAMVMNHLKKAKELNGNSTYGKAQPKVTKEEKATTSINMEILPESLKRFVQTLV